ncbi:sensor domain-containing diguanylate cyclase [Aliamphritea ceti]|uniref:sensor domain-containing diguanylate cyclase n=1 Tax=Aliamphritea ceti TaxID=1524258 RepID=UPI0021C2FDB3|nr:sensor domain-containing diguanylate cyclase [Aliamphritea ceti]
MSFVSDQQTAISEQPFALSPEVSIALARFISAIITARSEQQIYSILSRSLIDLIPNDRTSVTLLNNETQQLDIFSLHGQHGALPQGKSLPLENTFTGRAVKQVKGQLNKVKATTSVIDGKILYHEGIRCIINAPLIIHNQAIGAINSGHRNDSGFSRVSLQLLELIAQLVSANIERQRLLEDRQKAVSHYRFYATQLENLNRLAQQLSTVSSVTETLEITTRTLQIMMPSRRISYAAYCPEQDSFEITVLAGNEIMNCLCIPAEGTGLQLVMNSQEPMYFSDLGNSPHPEHQCLSERGMNCAWSIPVRSENRVIAVLNAASTAADTDPHRLMDILGTLSGIIGSVLERLNAQEKLIHQVNHDSVTGLPNRLLLNLQINELMQNHQSQRYALMFIDLDHFKIINDTLGHQIGDELLALVGKRMRHTIREEDLVARVGGDEFIVLMKDDNQASRSQETAHRIIDALSGPFDIKGETLNINASIGICLSSDTLYKTEDMIRAADMAMYEAKVAGRGTYRISQQQQPLVSSRKSSQ